MHTLVWANTNPAEVVTVDDGKLAALFRLRDQEITSVVDKLNQITAALIREVNNQHFQGRGIAAGMDPTVVLQVAGLSAPLAPGTFTINGTQFNVDPRTDTLAVIISRINGAGIGVTASLERDANGLFNIFRLTSAAPITLGAAGDTSNFFDSMRISGQSGQTTIQSTASLVQDVPHLFFSGSGAADVDVDSQIKANLNWVAAASGTNQPGDNTNARAIADLQRKLVLIGNLSQTIDDHYQNSLVSELGALTREMRTLADNQTTIVSQLEQRRLSISGVSLDEEASALVQFQRAYQAAARGITIIDEMLDTVINRMGVVGR